MEAFFVTLEADGDGDGDGVTLGSGSGSSSSGGCSNASDFDDEGTGLGTEVFEGGPLPRAPFPVCSMWRVGVSKCMDFTSRAIGWWIRNDFWFVAWWSLCPSSG